MFTEVQNGQVMIGLTKFHYLKIFALTKKVNTFRYNRALIREAITCILVYILSTVCCNALMFSFISYNGCICSLVTTPAGPPVPPDEVM